MKRHACEVIVTSAGKNPAVAVNPVRKLDQIARGDVVQWNFRNRSGQPLTLSIGHFAPAPRFAHLEEPRDENPFDEGTSLSVRLEHGRDGEVGGSIKMDAYFPRTYKYDVLGDGAILLDPEIEIER